MKKVKCSGCPAMIVWGSMLMPDGSRKRIPLDPKPAVYNVEERGSGLAVEATRNMGAMVSHFVTCPARNQFSEGGKSGN
jgi:hypothetical protein